MESEQIVIEAPMSFTGSAKRIWRWSGNFLIRVIILLPLIAVAWVFVFAWYCTFGLLLLPYRLIRRSQRKQKQAALRHRELLNGR